MKYKTLLVTGGCGFIGSNYIRHLFSEYDGIRVINADLLTYAAQSRKELGFEKYEGYTFRRLDVCDIGALRLMFSELEIDAVVHFAAESSVDRAFTCPEIFERTNVLGTQTLLRTASDFGVQRFLYVSTDEVYGSIENGSFTEKDDLNPMNPYSLSKARAEEIVRGYTGSMQTVITRSANNYGVGQYHDKLIPRCVKYLLEGKRIPVYGKGDQIRNWLFAQDNCSAISTVLEKGDNGEIYNVGSRDEVRNIDLIRRIISLLGLAKDEGEYLEYVSDRAVSEDRYSVCCKKIKELGWEQKTDFESGLCMTVKAYKEKYNS